MIDSPTKATITQAHRHSERLTEMAANTEGWWGFSPDDIAALEWSIERICALDTEVMRLRSLRPAR